MIRILLTFITILGTNFVMAQKKITKLQYARIEISVPEKYTAKSEYELSDCNGFSAQWLFLDEEMVKQKIHEQLHSQIERQIEYKKKQNIDFYSQNQKFRGVKYEMKDGTYRIIGFGRVDNMPLLLNLGFGKDPKNNSVLTEFEKNFITF